MWKCRLGNLDLVEIIMAATIETIATDRETSTAIETRKEPSNFMSPALEWILILKKSRKSSVRATFASLIKTIIQRSTEKSPKCTRFQTETLFLSISTRKLRNSPWLVSPEKTMKERNSRSSTERSKTNQPTISELLRSLDIHFF